MKIIAMFVYKCTTFWANQKFGTLKWL